LGYASVHTYIKGSKIKLSLICPCNTPSADQGSNGFFASIAYRADLQAQSVDLSPFIRYDINRIKMKANDILTSSETNTDEAWYLYRLRNHCLWQCDLAYLSQGQSR
jgi:hypothetical protein